MSRPALLDKLFQTGKTLFKPALIPVDNTTIKAVDDKLAVQKATATTIGGVKISGEDGLEMKPDGSAVVNFDAMPTDKFETMLKSIRVPIWLTGNKSFYVNQATGSDMLDSGRGESASKPFKTIQACAQYVADNYNISRYTCTIYIASGTYNEAVDLPKYNSTTGSIMLVGAGKDLTILTYTNSSALILQNAVAYTVSQIAIEMVTTSSFTATNSAAVNCRTGGNLTLSGCKVRVTCGKDGLNMHCIWAQDSRITIGDVDFESSLAEDATGSSLYCLYNQNSFSTIINDCTINGTYARIIEVILLGLFYKLRSTAPVITGTATGVRYSASRNSIIDTGGGGAEYFPGDAAGVTASGGQYL